MAAQAERSVPDPTDAALRFGAPARRRSASARPVAAAAPADRPAPLPQVRPSRYAAGAVWLTAVLVAAPLVAGSVLLAVMGLDNVTIQIASLRTAEPPAPAPAERVSPPAAPAAAAPAPDRDPGIPASVVAGQLNELRQELDRLKAEAAERRAAESTVHPESTPLPTPASTPPQPAPEPAAVAPADPRPVITLSVPVALRVLPAGAPARVQLRYARGNPAARARSLALADALRRRGATVIGARETSGVPATRVSYFYGSDGPQAEAIATLAGAGAPVRRGLIESDVLPRPGSIEVSIGGQ